MILKAKQLKSLANLLSKLPRLSILDPDDVGEVELQGTYYDAFLPEIIADQDQRVALRWTNKSVDEEQTDVRPAAILSSLLLHDFGHPLGFARPSPAKDRHAINLIVFRLGVACRRGIDKWQRPHFLAFIITMR